MGAGPGETVALLAPRSDLAIVAILAVLKTGAAYLPIDPAVPATRPGVHAGRRRTDHRDHDGRAGIPAGWADVQIVEVDDPAVESAGLIYPTTNLLPPSADDTAYLIYTSGNHRTPKAGHLLTAT